MFSIFVHTCSYNFKFYPTSKEKYAKVLNKYENNGQVGTSCKTHENTVFVDRVQWMEKRKKKLRNTSPFLRFTGKMSISIPGEATGAGTAARPKTQGPLGEGRIRQNQKMSISIPGECTGAGTAVRIKTQGALGERGIWQNKKKEFQDTGAISIPHGAAATARFLSQYRTALQPQRFCYLNTARVQGQR